MPNEAQTRVVGCHDTPGRVVRSRCLALPRWFGVSSSALLCLVLLTGCFAPPGDPGPVQADVYVDSAEDFDALWETTLRVLKRWHLTPDRQDPRHGVITTEPITTQQWFEFWRHDAMGPYQWLESSMHTVQRLAKIQIERLPESGRYRVNVVVDVFRMSAAERQVTTPSGALVMYSEKLPTEQGEPLKPHENVHWVHLGRDPKMEGVLLQRILVHYPGAYEMVDEPFEWDEPQAEADDPDTQTEVDTTPSSVSDERPTAPSTPDQPRPDPDLREIRPARHNQPPVRQPSSNTDPPSPRRPEPSGPSFPE